MIHLCGPLLALLTVIILLGTTGNIFKNASTVSGGLRGGGGGGVQAFNFGNFNFEIRVKGEGQDTSRFFRVVLGPCSQFY